MSNAIFDCGHFKMVRLVFRRVSVNPRRYTKRTVIPVPPCGMARRSSGPLPVRYPNGNDRPVYVLRHRLRPLTRGERMVHKIHSTINKLKQ